MSKSARNRLAAKFTKRSARGSGIIEGTVGLMLVSIGVVLFSGLLVNVGFGSYYKERLGFVADQTANYASMQSDEDKQKKVEEFAEALLKQMGFANQDTKVSLQEIEVYGEQATQVDITSDFPLFQQLGGVFPAKISLSERGVSTGDGFKVTGYVRFSISTQSGAQDPGTKSVASAMGPYASGGVMVPIIKVKGMQMGAGGAISGDKPILTAASIDKQTQALSPCVAASRDTLDPNQTARQGIGNY